MESGTAADHSPIHVQVISREVAHVPALQVYETLAGDRAPDDVYLFESAGGPPTDRQVTVVGWGRLAELQMYADRVELVAPPPLAAAISGAVSATAAGPATERSGTLVWPARDPWEVVRAVQGVFRVATDVPTSSFAFGFLTTLAYEAAWEIENLPPVKAGHRPPHCTLTLFRDVLWYDLDGGTVQHLSARGELLGVPADRPPAEVLAEVLAEAAVLASGPKPALPAAPEPRSVRDTVPRDVFLERVERCLCHIGAGDSYQIQIGHRIDVESDLTPYEVYRRLRHRSPSPYMYLVPWAGRTVIGASPELFFRLREGRITMRPIAGTAPRSADAATDARLAAELTTSAKEQAEHVMLVDLCRNDIGRVCIPGTLMVETMMEAEPFASVHHLVSTVSGQCRPDVDVWDTVRATFPAGTMTGAPKVRAMEIIHDIEDEPRGVYAGALGLVDTRGYAVFALCIRTAVHDGQRYSTQASAGVVADSVPHAEWRETLAKMSAAYWALTDQELLP
ncbi:anthranilate synthase component I family protein [Streptomyces broussonetiae]|uniref:anthranilate synthase component I family protein n=1 Tax=Streptomyces broussonetiae TaxID=2686304 RepID=UPI0023DD3EB9|nr:anthranilate synthase component I family protein [Streptomyces sp. FXJ1.172]WEP00535.1 anthranilate synthase component I family protein [Streptomyces sp. FXJ1.172]